VDVRVVLVGGLDRATGDVVVAVVRCFLIAAANRAAPVACPEAAALREVKGAAAEVAAAWAVAEAGVDKAAGAALVTLRVLRSRTDVRCCFAAA
jgi:hypothetical protein